MGFVSLLEDIEDRRTEDDVLSWRRYLGKESSQRDISEARDVLGDPFERPRTVVRKFWRHYQSASIFPSDLQSSLWERHIDNLRELDRLLADVSNIGVESDEQAWAAVCRIDGRLREFFGRIGIYGPMSREAVETVNSKTSDILRRCKDIRTYLEKFLNTVKELPAHEQEKYDLHSQVQKLEAIQQQLAQDLEGCDEYRILTDRISSLWNEFVRLGTALPVKLHYRPALKDLNRLRLHPKQEAFVTVDRPGHYRIQGTSGSGKTVILIHRALRLALANPNHRVRVFTINRSLAELLESTARTLHGTVLPVNLHVSSMYDFLLACLSLFEPMSKYRLADDKSNERINRSWWDFFQTQPIFQEKGVQRLVKSIAGQGGFDKLAAGRYLRDEIIYIESAYIPAERSSYLKDRRFGRSIQLHPPQRESVLKVLSEWDHWRMTGEQCDIHGIASLVGKILEDKTSLALMRSSLAMEHALIDEFQDFSTLELRVIQNLLTDKSSQNAIFLAGDVNQRVYVKQLSMSDAGFDFRGRSDLLTQNYRNTRQILRAAYALIEAFPPQIADLVDVAHPDYSVYDGGRPLAIACGNCDHAGRIVEIVKMRHNARIAVISENVELLNAVRQRCRSAGIALFDLLSNEDIDLWKKKLGDSLAPLVVLSGMEAVKGFEFDTVIAADLSKHLLPPPGVPSAETWRSAAVLYSALTRARDELILTFTHHPSVFLQAMRSHVDFVVGADEEKMMSLLR